MVNLKSKTILVVDDERLQIKLLQSVLSSNGYQVLTAETGEVCLEILKHNRPDLILLDIMLPGIQGKAICEIIKKDEATKSIPVVFVTAKDTDEDIQAGFDAGAEAHLTKPIDSVVLLATLKGILN